MKKVLTLSLLGFFLASLIASPGFSQTAKEILGKMIEAQGGKKAFESVKDMTVSGSIELVQQALSGSLTIHKKEPDKRRTDIEIMGFIITQVYDGETAWWTNPQTGGTEELSGRQAEDLKRQALPLESFIYPEKYGISFALKEKEKIEEKDYFVLEETYPDGHKVTYYIDPETYLTYKTRASTVDQFGQEVEIEQFVSDYKKVNGMIMAHSTHTLQDGEEYMKITFSEVKFNTGLEDSLFEMSE